MLTGSAPGAIAIPVVAAGRDDDALGDFEWFGQVLAIERAKDLEVIGAVVFEREKVDGDDLSVKLAVQPVDTLDLGFRRNDTKSAVGRAPSKTAFDKPVADVRLADKAQCRIEIAFDAAVVNFAPPALGVRRAQRKAHRGIVAIQTVRSGSLIPERAGDGLAIRQASVQIPKIDTDQRIVLVTSWIAARNDGAER